MAANARLEADQAALQVQLASLKAAEEKERLESLESLARLEAMAEKVVLSLQTATPQGVRES